MTATMNNRLPLVPDSNPNLAREVALARVREAQCKRELAALKRVRVVVKPAQPPKP
jgi:hypothetical protein